MTRACGSAAGCRGRHDLGELVLEVDAGHARDLGSRHHLAVRCGDVERVGRVEHEPHVVAQVGPDASGRLTAEVRLDPADRDRADPALAQPCVEIDISAADGGVVPAGEIARMTGINLQDEFAEVVTTAAACSTP